MQMNDIDKTIMFIKLTVMIISISFGHAITEPCATPDFIDNWKRSVNYVPLEGKYLCDSLLVEGWYRITSKAGELMPTECITDGYKCGTSYPIYLSKDDVPDDEDIYPAEDITVNRTAYAVVDDDCENAQYQIKIKNCTSYLVYYLRPIIGCDTAYCFGKKLPCPDGESSSTGFTPNCSSVYPNISLTTTIEVDFHSQTTGSYITESPKFVCSALEATDEYAYDINFYINEVLILGAIYTHVSIDDISTSHLLQDHWVGLFKPNMMVKCAIQARYTDRGVAGDKHFSDDFFAGIKVIDGENGIYVEEGQTKQVQVEATLPIGCKYHVKTPRKSSCYVGLYNGVPKYQYTENNQVECSSSTFVQSNLEFSPENCRLQIFHETWNRTHYINVTGRSDSVVNRADRIVFLRLYTTPKSASLKEVLQIWNTVTLPDLKIYIVDKDIQLLGSACYSYNDPYMRTFDQKTWDFLSGSDKGEYVLYKHERLPQQVNVYFTPCVRGTNGLCNCAVAVRSANSIFIANFCETGRISSRKINRYITARLCDDQNLIVSENTDSTYTITFPSGTVVFLRHAQLSDTVNTINMIQIRPSILDTDLTTGLCGRYNDNDADDFFTRGNLDSKHDTDAFARSWKIQNAAETFFNSSGLPVLTYKVQEYCTCDADENIQDPSYQHEPNFECRLSDQMKTCRQIELPTTVVHATCISISQRVKRSLEEEDETPPMYDMTDDALVIVADEPVEWRNGLTEEIARQKCEDAFNTLPALDVCGEYVPTVKSSDYISQCISDMKVAGSDVFLTATLRNFETVCLNDASQFENLTDTNTTGPGGEPKSIFSVIAESTCPRNCSGNGSCFEGKCVCNEGKYGGDCSLDKSKPPRLIKKAFADTCDTSVKACSKFVIPGSDFISDNLTCRFRHFYVQNGSYTTDADSITTPGTYSSSFMMICNLPRSRKKRSAAKAYVASGYFISVSNNGNDFTEDLTVIIVDARCYECNSSTYECTEMDTCPTKAKETETDSLNVIGIGIGSALAFVIILLILMVLVKKRCMSRKSAVGDSRTSLSKPQGQYERSLDISTTNSREYSQVLASSQISIREPSSLVVENPQYENSSK